VQVRRYQLAATPDRFTGGICEPADVVRVRLVSRPGQPLKPWVPVGDWLDYYVAPDRVEQP
jgi:hypothetical protein